jgi:acyl carrier protein
LAAVSDRLLARLRMTSQDIFQTLKTTLIEQFELDPESITPQARLKEDLDLDSIDAVDMIIKMQELTGCKISPEEFKQVQTVGDVEQVVARLVAANPGPAA